jgi:hypothetical protein
MFKGYSGYGGYLVGRICMKVVMRYVTSERRQSANRTAQRPSGKDDSKMNDWHLIKPLYLNIPLPAPFPETVGSVLK